MLKHLVLKRHDFEYKSSYRANLVLTPYFSESKALRGYAAKLGLIVEIVESNSDLETECNFKLN